jgi:hypothetical protein
MKKVAARRYLSRGYERYLRAPPDPRPNASLLSSYVVILRQRLARVACGLAVLAWASPTSTAIAQNTPRARGAGPDALTPPAGVLRIAAGATWTRNAEAWFNGTLRELGGPFSFDSLTPAQLPLLAPADAASRVASGLSSFTASLGSIGVHARRTYETTPVGVEYGLTSRLAIGVTVPLVTSALRVAVLANPTGSFANFGINPALGIPALATNNGTLVGQIESAAAFVSGKIATCSANPAAAGCSGFNTATAQTLVTESLAYSSAVATLYGGKNGSTGTPFVPIQGSSVDLGVASRLADLKTRFAAAGATQVTNAAPVGAAGPLTTAQFLSVLSDSAFGIRANPFGSVVRRGMGNVELNGQFTWHDSYASAAKAGSWTERLWWRSAIGGAFRLGTGEKADAADLIPVPLGDEASTLVIRSTTDVGTGERWSVTGALAVARQQEISQVTVDVAPRWTPTDAISVAAIYTYRTLENGEKVAESQNPAAAAAGAYFGALGEAMSQQREHRLGAAVSYSSLTAYDRGKARLPLEVSLSHFQSTGGSGVFTPKLSHDEVTVRYYWSPRRAAPARARD